VTAARTICFGTLSIVFDNRVLEPRPWTVMQADWAHELEPTLPEGPFLELGCGAGHIGLAAVCGNGRHLVQLDSESGACDIAAINTAAAGLAERVEVRCGDFDQTLSPAEKFALVLADPPYVPTSETSRYPDDPPEAIDGGADGLDGIRAALRVAAAHLERDGAVLLQVWGADQARQTQPIAEGLGLDVTGVRTHDERRAVALLRPRT
jgi:methylase of polypeptide subunit release factors